MTKKMAFNLPTGLAIMLSVVVGITLQSLMSLNAQPFYGSIVGTVTDASGAVVTGATVTITNLGTGETRAAKSNTAGDYEFVNLVPAL
jgi:Carboxypeptidase regulatory-like domain